MSELTAASSNLLLRCRGSNPPGASKQSLLDPALQMCAGIFNTFREYDSLLAYRRDLCFFSIATAGTPPSTVLMVARVPLLSAFFSGLAHSARRRMSGMVLGEVFPSIA